MKNSDEKWLHVAFELAKHAIVHGEIPVGAVLVLDNQIIGQGYNSCIAHHDPTAHAEILALRQGALFLKNYRLTPGTSLYVTLEPCSMCLAAMRHARVDRLVFGAYDAKGGRINHTITITGGIVESPCSNLIKDFFKARRGERE